MYCIIVPFIILFGPISLSDGMARLVYYDTMVVIAHANLLAVSVFEQVYMFLAGYLDTLSSRKLKH